MLIVAGIQMLAIGLLGELQVRHYHTSQHPRAVYDRPHGAPALRRKSRACCPIGTEKARNRNREQKSPARTMSGRGFLFLQVQVVELEL